FGYGHRAMGMMRRVLRGAVALFLSCNALTAFALRPFDSTDAAVAEPGELEIELGPWGKLREGDKRFRIAPAVAATYGVAEGRELVVQGARQVALDADPDEPRSSVVENGVFVKQVLRPGVLQ